MQSNLFDRLVTWLAYGLLVQFRQPQIEELSILPYSVLTLICLACMVASFVLLPIDTPLEILILALLFPLLDKVHYYLYFESKNKVLLILVVIVLLCVSVALVILLFVHELYVSGGLAIPYALFVTIGFSAFAKITKRKINTST